MKIVLIEWVDSRQPAPEWQRVSGIGDLSEARCTSVGFLVRETKDAKVLAISVADHGDDPQASGVFVIPSRAILKLRVLSNLSPK